GLGSAALDPRADLRRRGAVRRRPQVGPHRRAGPAGAERLQGLFVPQDLTGRRRAAPTTTHDQLARPAIAGRAGSCAQATSTPARTTPSAARRSRSPAAPVKTWAR